MFPFEKLIVPLQGVLANVPEVSGVGLRVSAHFSEWTFVCEALQSIAAFLDTEFLSAPLYGYLLVFQKTEVCNCFLCAKLARVDPVPKRLCCLCSFFYWENSFMSFEVELHSPLLPPTQYTCTSTPHKHRLHSQASHRHTTMQVLETNAQFSSRLGDLLHGFQACCRRVLKLNCSLAKSSLRHGYGLF